MNSRFVSFVVPAHDEERLLPSTLHAIRAAADTCAIRHEIIVVDDASTDRTAQIAVQYGARVVPVQHRQISTTRNSGARAAGGELLVFVDADTIINSRVLHAALQACDNGAIGGGAMVRFDGNVPLYARALLPILTKTMRAARLAAGCFVFCTRSAFEAACGFDERLFASEEIAFSVAMKKLGRFVIVGEHVTTSGRKLRAYSLREVVVLMARLAYGGRRLLERRDHLGLWYEPRREDPQIRSTTSI